MLTHLIKSIPLKLHQARFHFYTTMSTPSIQKYSALIIGSGQAGTPLASAFAKAGHKTALIESVHIGGCCVNEGCTPTKTMITSGRVAHLARRGQDYGIKTSEENKLEVDMKKIRQRKRDIVTSFRTGSEKRVDSAGVHVLLGTARFIDAKTVAVKRNDGLETLVEGEKIFINVGERPSPPSLSGIETITPSRVLDSTSVQELDSLPEHLVVIGGGYVGVEFAQLFRRLGSKVTILQRGNQLLPREDAEITTELLSILLEDGCEILLQSTATSISPSPNNQSSFELRIQTSATGGSETRTIEGSHILFASGRVPNSDTLNLSAAGIATDSKGYIVTDEYLTTNVPHIFALGDVKGPPAFTHISYDDFRIVEANHISKAREKGEIGGEGKKRSIKDRDGLVPYVVYTDPQLAHVGVHELEARAKFPERNIKAAKMPMAYVARALETGETRGMMKAVVDAEGEILGFTCLGIEGGEVMSVVQMAMMGGVKWMTLRDAVFAHPSLAESLNNLWGFLE